MKRIVFLDYVRVFACFLVMLVHASENYYGAVGVGEMAGPQSYLANETDRLWVSVYDGFSRMSVPLFMIVSAYLLVPMKPRQTSWQFYCRRFLHILPPFFLFMILYSTICKTTFRFSVTVSELVMTFCKTPENNLPINIAPKTESVNTLPAS